MEIDGIEKAKELARELRAIFYEQKQGGRVPVALNTEQFAQFVGERKGIAIDSVISSHMGAHLKGMLYRRSDQDAVILIADNNNECWRRFVYIKEICHLFLDNEADYNIDAESIAVALLGDKEAAPVSYCSEVCAAYAAIEILIPEDRREWIAHQSNIEKKTLYQIAFMLKVPRKYVELRMMEWDIPINTEENGVSSKAPES